MQAFYSNRFRRSYQLAPSKVKSAFDKKLIYLLKNLRHPSLHAKKYNEELGIWQARVNRDWRFYFIVDGDAYRCIDIMQHPK